jgi:DNA-binding NarL/FixJ family response regulator
MRILAVDDHPPILAAMQMILRELAESAEIESVHDLAGAFAAAGRAPFDLVMLDLALPDCGGGLDALVRFRERFPALPVVVVSGASEAGVITQAIELGALGFIPKSTSMDKFLPALRLVLSGGTYVPAEVLRAPPAGAGGTAELNLSPRQREVLALLTEGLSNKLIARKLDISENTTKIHVSAVLAALGVQTRAQAIVKVGRLPR